MIDSVTIYTTNFVTYSEEYFSKAQYQELRGEYGVFGRHTTRYTTYPQKCKAKGLLKKYNQKARRYPALNHLLLFTKSRDYVRGLSSRSCFA